MKYQNLEDSNYLGAINRNDRVGALYRAWGHIFSSQITGDYIEFGVYRGTTFIESYKIYQYFLGEAFKNSNSNELWRREVSKKKILNTQEIFMAWILLKVYRKITKVILPMLVELTPVLK